MASHQIRCPPGLKAFSGYPSLECPTASHYYKCVNGLAVVDVCPNSTRYMKKLFFYMDLKNWNSFLSYQPTLNRCDSDEDSVHLRRKRSIVGSSASSDSSVIEQDALGREVHLGKIIRLLGQNYI